MNKLELAIYELEKLAEDFGYCGYSMTHDHLKDIAENLKLFDKMIRPHDPSDSAAN